MSIMKEMSAETTLGRYRLMSKVGHGGMGEVWLAEDPRLRRKVAVKMLPLHGQDDDDYLQRFEREARATAALHHPHILPVHDYGKQEQASGRVITYIVMSYIAGGSLGDRLHMLEAKHALLPPAEALAYLMQMASAIDYAHQHGIIHRDIKPANILLHEDNWLLLADFGIARILADTEQLTQTGGSFGTPKYMSPEQAQGRAVAASDTYSLAVIAYQMFAGRAPFSGDTPYATTIQHISQPPPPPRQFNTFISPLFAEALLHGLAKEPVQRPSSATAFVSELQHAFEQLPFSYPAQILKGIEPTSYQTEQAVEEWQTDTPVIADAGTQATETAQTRPVAFTRRGLLIGGGVGGLVIAAGGGIIGIHTWLAAQARVSNLSNLYSATFTIPSPFSNPVTLLNWSPVEDTLVATNGGSGLNSQIAQWSIRSDRQPKQIVLKPVQFVDTVGSGINGISWSPDGKMIAVGPIFSSDSTHFIQVDTSNLEGSAAGFDDRSIKLTTNNNILEGLCWNTDNILFLLQSIPDDFDHIQLSAFNMQQISQKIQPAIIAFTTGDLQKAALANTHDGKQLAISVQNSASQSDFFKGLVVGNVSVLDGQVGWQDDESLPPNLKRGQGRLLSTGTDQVFVAAWSGDDRYLAALTDAQNVQQDLYVWDKQQNYHNLATKFVLTGITGTFKACCWSPLKNRALLAVGNDGGNIYIWDMQKGSQAVRVLTGISDSITALAWSHDGMWLAASYSDTNNSILVWRLNANL